MNTRVGPLLRESREHLGLDRAVVAAKAHIAADTLRKIEQGTRAASYDVLAALADALDIRAQLREYLIRADHPRMFTDLHAPADDAEIAHSDLLELELTPYPFALTSVPLFDVIACNQAYEDLLPGLTAGGNAIIWMMTDPRAPRVVKDWRGLAHGMVNALRQMQMAGQSPHRVQEIIAACAGHPEWDTLWRTLASHPKVLSDLVHVADAQGNNTTRYIVRIDRAEYPRRTWMRYRLIPDQAHFAS